MTVVDLYPGGFDPAEYAAHHPSYDGNAKENQNESATSPLAEVEESVVDSEILDPVEAIIKSIPKLKDMDTEEQIRALSQHKLQPGDMEFIIPRVEKLKKEDESSAAA